MKSEKGGGAARGRARPRVQEGPLGGSHRGRWRVTSAGASVSPLPVAWVQLQLRRRALEHSLAQFL